MYDDYFCESDYAAGRDDGQHSARKEFARLMTEARKGATPEVVTTLDALADSLKLTTITEVRYTA